MSRPRSSPFRAAVAALVIACALVTIAQPIEAGAGPTAGVAAARQVIAVPSIVVMRSTLAARGDHGSAETSAAHATAQRAIDRLTRSLGVRPSRRYRSALDGFAAVLTPSQVAVLRRDPAVSSVTPDAPTDIGTVDTDPAADPGDRGIHTTQLSSPVVPTGVQRLNADRSPIARIDGVDDPMDVDVAIIDTGIAPHKDLRIAGGYDCTSSDPSAWRDRYGHGTHVAGTVGAIDNKIGVVGVAPGARLWAVKVFNDEGRGFISSYLCGIDWVAAQRDATRPGRPLIEVANMSFDSWLPSTDSRSCGSDADDPVHVAVCGLVDGGTTAVVAAGNDSGDARLRLPAAYDEAITVSALADFDGKPGGDGRQADICPWYSADRDDTFADFSNYGSAVDLIAPGKCILSTFLNNRYAWMSGTSMASPAVAGAAALLYARNPNVSPELVRQALLAATTFDWKTNTDPDGHPDPLLDVSRLGPLPNFTLHVPAPQAVLEPGGTLVLPITLDRTNGLVDPVDLSVSGLPNKVSAELAPASTTGDTATLTLRAAGSLVSKTRTITVHAVGGGRSRAIGVPIQLRASGAAMQFTAPAAGATSDSASPSVHVALEAAQGATPATSRMVQRQLALPAVPGTCAAAIWQDDGPPVDLATLDPSGTAAGGWSFDASGLSDGCVRWLVTTVDGKGRQAAFASGSLIVDTVAPLGPTVTVTGSGSYQHHSNDPIWIRGGVTGSATLTIKANDVASGAGRTAVRLVSGNGISVRTLHRSGDPATAELDWGPNATDGTIEARTTDAVGHVGPWRRIDVRVDGTAPGRPSWEWPASGRSFTVTNTPSLLWSDASDSGSGVARLQLVQRERGAIVTQGSCAGVEFSDDGVPRLLDRHHVERDLVSGYCYRYVLWPLDRVGNRGHKRRSGEILSDLTPPTGDFTTPDEGTTTVLHATSITVEWSRHETGGSGGLRSHLLERERGTPAEPGSCNGVAWAPDKYQDTGPSPSVESDLRAGDCYRWRLNLTDRADMASVEISGSVLVEP